MAARGAFLAATMGLIVVGRGALAKQAMSDAEITIALGDDEVCGTHGDEAATCALHALQAKALKVDSESAGEAQGACDSGMVGQIKSFAPACINACQQACGPLGESINAYLAHGGQPAAKKVICAHKAQFSCAYSHWSACKPLADKAAGFGFKLPMSQHELDTGC